MSGPARWRRCGSGRGRRCCTRRPRAGPVWMKAGGPQIRRSRRRSTRCSRAWGTRARARLRSRWTGERAWILLPDAGRSLGEQAEGEALVAPFAAALGALRPPAARAGAAHPLACWRPAYRTCGPRTMPARFHEALAAAAPDGPLRARVAAMGGRGSAGGASGSRRRRSPPSLDHNDLHPWNVVGRPRWYDWGDSVLAHPFAAMLVPLGVPAAPARMRARRPAALARPRRVPGRVRATRRGSWRACSSSPAASGRSPAC